MDETLQQSSLAVLLLQCVVPSKRNFSERLRQMGCEITIASNFKEAMKFYNETQVNPFNLFGTVKYDFIVMSIFPHLENGISTITGLRKTFYSLPPVFALLEPGLNGNTNRFVRRLLKKGFDDAIVFPNDETHIRSVFQQWKNNKEMLMQKHQRQVFCLSSIDKAPVISLQTYTNFSEQAAKNRFSLAKLYNTFVEEMENYIASFIWSYEKSDAITCEKLITTIRGMSGSMGASQLYLIANQVDIKLKSMQFREVGELLPFLIEKHLVMKDFVSQIPFDKKIFVA